jgi:hypothetical protein
VPETVAPDAGDVIDTATAGGVVLFTVIETAGLVALLFDVSVATADTLCLPLGNVVVFKDAEYGAVVSAAPRFEPSTWNWMLAIPMLLDALAARVIVPERVIPAPGDVIETTGSTDPPVAGLLTELVSPAQAALRMANGRTRSHSLRVIVSVNRFGTLPGIITKGLGLAGVCVLTAVSWKFAR